MSQKASFRKSLLGAAILGLASVFLTIGDVRAGTLIINITDGVNTYDIFDQVPPDVNVNLNQIQADTTGLTFANFTLVGLNASSNNPGTNADGALLTVSGHVTQEAGAGAATLTITTYQTGYTLPSVGPYTMISTTSSTFNTAGSTQTFESWYNSSSPATPPPPFGTPAPLITLPLSGTNSSNGTTMLAGLPASPSFSLTNQIVLTLGGSSASDIGFSGKTQILGVPEPTSVIMLGTAAPLALILMSRIRRLRKQTAA